MVTLRTWAFCILCSLCGWIIFSPGVTYAGVYASIFAMLLFYVIISGEISSRILSLYLLTYFGIALLNISTYRGYISVETIQIYFVSLASLILPMVLLQRRPVTLAPDLRPSPITNLVIVAHLAIAWLATLYVYGAIGPVLIKQNLRFGIPTAIGYTIRSVQFIPVYMLVCRDKSKFWISLPYAFLLSLIPTLLIASRATVALVLLAMGLLSAILQNYGWQSYAFEGNVLTRLNRSRTRMGVLIVAAVAGLVIIIGGFYLRRSSGDGNLMTGTEFVSRYFDASNPLSYLIAPVHQGFNETAALTSKIVDRGIINQQTSTPLLWADFDNLLGRSSVAAAQYFGNVIGRAEDGGLTPGLVGGVLLDFPNTYYWWFLGLGSLLAVARFFAAYSRRALCVYTILLSQVFHLIHRGFIKPEYLTIVFIAMFYMMTLKGSRFILDESSDISSENRLRI